MENKTTPKVIKPVTIRVLPSDNSAPITIKLQLPDGSRIRVLFE